MWQRYYKQIYELRKVLESGVYSSVLAKNNSFTSFKNVFKKFDIQPFIFLEGAHSQEYLRVENKNKNSLKVSNNRRKKSRARKKAL